MTIDGLQGWLLLTAPMAVLLLVMLAVGWIARRPARATVSPGVTHRYGTPVERSRPAPDQPPIDQPPIERPATERQAGQSMPPTGRQADATPLRRAPREVKADAGSVAVLREQQPPSARDLVGGAVAAADRTEAAHSPPARRAAASDVVVPPTLSVPQAPASGPPVPSRAADELSQRLMRAEATNDEPRIAEHSVALARLRLQEGRTKEAADGLRRAIWIAARLGLKRIHAEARLELGDIMLAAGDTTTACEHWQIARGLLFDERDATKLALAEGRMKRTGCPTDWVLNDF